MVHAEVRVIVGVDVAGAVFGGGVFDLDGGGADAAEGYPVVVALV